MGVLATDSTYDRSLIVREAEDPFFGFVGNLIAGYLVASVVIWLCDFILVPLGWNLESKGRGFSLRFTARAMRAESKSQGH